MRKYLYYSLVWLSLAACVSSCTQAEKPVMQENSVTIERDYLHILEGLTAMMRADTTPEETLDALRKYVETDKPKVVAVVNALNKDILAMDEDARAAWRKKAIPNLNQALERFAQAQMQLQKKMNVDQRWELGEILSLLKP